MISLNALYVALRGNGMMLHHYREFRRFNWYHSLSNSGAIVKHTHSATYHTIRAVPHEFMCWASSCGFWTEQEINEVAGIVLSDMLKDED